ncbi:MAG: hypothetical protein ACRD1L_00430 [Terriglobales bacterium]
MPSRRSWGVVGGAAAVAVTAAAAWALGFRPWAPRVVRMLPAGETLVYLNVAPLRHAGWPGGGVRGRAPGYAGFVQESGFDFERDLDAVGISLVGRPDRPNAATVALAGRFGGRFEAYLRRHALSQMRLGRVIGYRFPGWARPQQPLTVVLLDRGHVLVTNSADPTPVVAGAERWWPRAPSLWPAAWRPPGIAYFGLDALRLAAERQLDGAIPPWQGAQRIEARIEPASDGGLSLRGRATMISPDAAVQLLTWARHARDTWRSALAEDALGPPPRGLALRALLDQLTLTQSGGGVSFELRLDAATVQAWRQTLAAR